MKTLFWISPLFAVGRAAAAEQCVTETHEYQGRQITFQTCDALGEDVVKATVDGHHFTAYIVKLDGQRIVVSDILSRTAFAVGDQIHFLFGKHDNSGYATLSFEILEPESEARGCCYWQREPGADDE